MDKLSKKRIIIITITAIAIITLVIVGGAFGIHSGNKKESANKEDKTESVDKNETDEEEKETDTENDETSVVEDESKKETTTEETPEVEEPKSETPKTETPSNTNQNNNTNTGNNTGNNGGGTTTPSNPTPSTPTPESEKSPYAGMYTLMDEASKTRFVTCGNILRGGLAGQYIQVRETFIDYFSGEIVMINGTTDGAWMYLCIAGWSTNGGTAETAPIYDELPSLAKQCMETIAPDGGTALYNTINSLILQYGGARMVPTQGRISESIPGLYVTVTQGRSGLEIEFWAE